MSRFDKDTVDYDSSNLEETSCDVLMSKLEEFVTVNQNLIREKIDGFRRSDKDYSIIELSDEVALVVKRSERNQTILCLGYPFKLCSRDILNEFSRKDKQTTDCVSASIHLRGKSLRNKQREMLIKMLGADHGTCEYVQITSQEEFRNLANAKVLQATAKKSFCAYVDPYNFIGDSIVGLYFLDYFVKIYGIKRVKVLSRAHKHIGFFYDSAPKDKPTFDAETEESELIIMPDLIDNHFSSTMKLLSEVKAKKLVVFIISRNLIVEFDNGAVRVYHYAVDDILLQSESVREYMENALSPYAVNTVLPELHTPHNNVVQAQKSGGANILVNPFSSDVLKDISTDDVKRVLTLFQKSTARTVYVTLGTNGDREQKWMKKLSNAKAPEGVTIVSIVDNELADLARQIDCLRIRVALTVDTALSHMLTRMNVPNVTIYNDGFWDENSPQSLSAESPLGFCSQSPCQMPAIKPRGNFSPNFIGYVANALEDIMSNFSAITEDRNCMLALRAFHEELLSFLKSMRSNGNMNGYDVICYKYYSLKKAFINSPMGWIFEIYDPVRLLKGITSSKNTRIIPLVHSVWRVSPIFKLSNLITPLK